MNRPTGSHDLGRGLVNVLDEEFHDGTVFGPTRARRSDVAGAVGHLAEAAAELALLEGVECVNPLDERRQRRWHGFARLPAENGVVEGHGAVGVDAGDLEPDGLAGTALGHGGIDHLELRVVRVSQDTSRRSLMMGVDGGGRSFTSGSALAMILDRPTLRETGW